MIHAMSGHTHVNLAVQDADDEAAARRFMRGRGVPLDHVHFFHIEHADIWTRDTGPQFTRSRSGNLRISDWNFNYWGNEEPGSEFSALDEPFDRTVASVIRVPVLDAREGPTGVRMINEGGSATHNGRGTMIAVESVVMQRNLGPNRFCGGGAPRTDYDQPNTYAPNPDWPACKLLVERELRRMLGVKKVIWERRREVSGGLLANLKPRTSACSAKASAERQRRRYHNARLKPSRYEHPPTCPMMSAYAGS